MSITKLYPIGASLNNNLPYPQMGINSWQQPLKCKVRTQTINDDGEVVITDTNFPFITVIQPLSPEERQLKPEGQWNWDWYWMHAKPNLILNNNDVIVYKDVEYLIYHNKNYSDYGHVEYHAIKDWQRYVNG